MTYVIFDTETTGLPNDRLPPDHPDQPHVCQLAAQELDDDRRVVTEINVLIKPDGWTIPAQATAVHGITQATAERYGIKVDGALALLRRMISRSRVVIAHNLEFDARMIARDARGASWADVSAVGYCTMTAGTDVVKRPPTERMLAKGMTGYKKPSLTEAYRHFFGRDFAGAHDAMADVRACRDVYFALLDESQAAEVAP